MRSLAAYGRRSVELDRGRAQRARRRAAAADLGPRVIVGADVVALRHAGAGARARVVPAHARRRARRWRAGAATDAVVGERRVPGRARRIAVRAPLRAGSDDALLRADRRAHVAGAAAATDGVDEALELLGQRRWADRRRAPRRRAADRAARRRHVEVVLAAERA